MPRTIIDNDESKLGPALIERQSNKKYRDAFDKWNDNSLEHYKFILYHVNNLIKILRCTETVEDSVYSYSYKDAVLFKVDLKKGEIDFPVCNEVIAYIQQSVRGNGEVKDNPLIGFALGFLIVDRHIYGPAQGMYNMFMQFDKGYLVSHYPETREWLKI